MKIPKKKPLSYKNIRVHEIDYTKLKTYANRNSITLVCAASVAVDKLCESVK